MTNVGGGQSNRSPKAAALLAMLLTVDGAGSLLDADKLDGADWAAPLAIGSTTPAAGSFTTLSATGAVTLTTASTGLTIGITTGTSLVVSSTAAICATFGGGATFGGSLATSASGTTVTSTITNTNAAAASGVLAGFVATNDAGVSINNRVYGSGASNTIFGITMANWTTIVGTNASVAGMLLGPTGATSSALVFGVGANETARFSTGTIASGVFSVAYTLDASAVGTASVTLAGGLSVAKQVQIAGAVTLSTASSGLTIAKTTGTTLVVSSTTTSTTTATGCATFAGGVGIAGTVTFGGALVTKINSGSTINLDLSDTAVSRTVQMFRVNTSATAHTTQPLYDVISGASTSADLMVRVRANSVNLWTMSADGTTAASGVWSMTNTTDATSITTGGVVLSGGLGVAKRLCLDGATGKTLRITNGVANAAVATTLGSVGPTGSTAGNPQGWMRVDINGTDRYIPYW